MGTVARKAVLVVVALAAATGGAGLVLRAPSAGAIPAPVHVVVPGTAGGDGHGGIPPVATGVVLGPLDAVVITATGTVNLSAGGSAPPILNGPDGGNPAFPSAPGGSLVSLGRFGCLAARIGSGGWRCIGAGPTVLTGIGEVFLGVNDGFFGGNIPGYQGNSGQFAVTLAVGSTYPPDMPAPTFRSSASSRRRR